MTLFFMKTSVSQKKFHLTFFSHLITLFLQILGERVHGPSPHLKFCWGTIPPVPQVSAHGSNHICLLDPSLLKPLTTALNPIPPTLLQGSVLGPLLFYSIYDTTKPSNKIIFC